MFQCLYPISLPMSGSISWNLFHENMNLVTGTDMDIDKDIEMDMDMDTDREIYMDMEGISLLLRVTVSTSLP